jgi:hypothetical protein
MFFAVHGVNESGRAELLKPKVSRDQLLPLNNGLTCRSFQPSADLSASAR